MRDGCDPGVEGELELGDYPLDARRGVRFTVFIVFSSYESLSYGMYFGTWLLDEFGPR